MKRLYFIFLLIFFSGMAQGQYFDWNSIIISSDFSSMSTAAPIAITANPKGGYMISYYVTSFGWPTNYVEVHDSILNTVSHDATDTLFNCYFDHNGNHLIYYQDATGYQYNYYRSSDTLYFHFNSNVSFDGDTSGMFYFFCNYGTTDSVMVFDANGNFINSIYQNFTTGKADDYGNIFLAVNSGNSSIYKIHWDGTLLNTYSGSSDFKISRKGTLWYFNNTSYTGIDTSGTVISKNFPLSTHYDYAVDANDNVYAWREDDIYKFNNNIQLWHAKVDVDQFHYMDADNYGNIYYTGVFERNRLDNGWEVTSINIPPSLYEVFDEFYYSSGSEKNVYVGKINANSPDTFYCSFSVPQLCTGATNDLMINWHQFPVVYSTDTVFFEISDSTGSFANPVIAGKGFNAGFRFTTPSLPESAGYQCRIRLENGIYISPATPLTIYKSPLAEVILKNSISNIYSCIPFELSTNADSGLTYQWFESYDEIPSDPSQITNLNNNDSLLLISTATNRWYKVIITDSNGCVSESNAINPQEMDSTYNFDHSFPLPDTISYENFPATFYLSNHDTITGNGLSAIALNVYTDKYTFNPASAGAGMDTLVYLVEHNGNPCVPFSFQHYIYVDSVPTNIILDSVSNNKFICEGDTHLFSFTFIDSTVYAPTNIFTVKMGYRDGQGNFNFISDIGSGTSLPVTAIYPPVTYCCNLSFRIYSSDPPGYSTLNPDGMKQYGAAPGAWTYGGLNAGSTCFPLNDTIKIVSTYSYHNWYLNNNLIQSDTGNYSSIYTSTEGNYQLILTDTLSKCKNSMPVVTVDDSSYFPVITLTPSGSPVNICQQTGTTFHAAVDSIADLLWFMNGNPVTFGTDSLLINQTGTLTVTATSHSGCPVVSEISTVVQYSPFLHIIPVNPEICLNRSATLGANYLPGNIFHWKDLTGINISSNNNIVINAPGQYYAEVEDSSGCITRSDTIDVHYKVTPVTLTPAGIINLKPGASITLHALNSTGNTLQWIYGTTLLQQVTQPDYTTNLLGTYYINVTDSTLCQLRTNSVTVQREYVTNTIPPPAERFNSANASESVLVYPNPAIDFINIKTIGYSGKAAIFIYDATERLMLQEFLSIQNQEENQIKVSSLPSGNYSIYIITEPELYVKSFIKIE